MADDEQDTDLEGLGRRLLAVVKANGYRRLDEPVELASGELSRDFVDAKAALSAGADLRLACTLILATTAAAGFEFEAVGGLTMGADHLAHGVALVGDRRWFVVRKQAKGRGTNRRIEGTTLGPGVRALVVEDVVTTGGSMIEAVDLVLDTGAEVAGAVTVVDRGDRGTRLFAERGVPYLALLTYRDLDIEPVGGGT